MSLLELTAVIFGIICVVLTIKQHIACWPTGLVMVILYIWIFYEARLFSDVALQVVYIFLQIYGWYHWAKGGNRDNPLPVTLLSWKARLAWGLVALLGTLVLGYSMNRWAAASLPYWDATAAVLSLIAQWFLARKLLESWVVWIAVDVLSIGIYGVKGLYLTMGLYFLFLGLATAGLLAWRKEWRTA
ncbi:MAG: aminotransferase [Verrucomicrobia bacterium 61-8]|nr:nicotinamide mononucleotide transporter [Verrucomicrobiota bacterium]OJV25749.1 MAG: aminotransferase [Verrucomicrobia bacterium 61-8]